LDKYSFRRQPAVVEDNFAFAPQHALRATVNCRMADGDTTMSAAF
jgi:hypothetical protein